MRDPRCRPIQSAAQLRSVPLTRRRTDLPVDGFQRDPASDGPATLVSTCVWRNGGFPTAAPSEANRALTKSPSILSRPLSRQSGAAANHLRLAPPPRRTDRCAAHPAR